MPSGAGIAFTLLSLLLAVLLWRSRAGREGGVGLDPCPPVQPPEPLDAGRVDIEPAGEHVQVQLLQDLRVRRLQPRVVEPVETGVQAPDALKRRPRAVPVIEEGVVEVEEYGANHTTIIERVR